MTFWNVFLFCFSSFALAAPLEGLFRGEECVGSEAKMSRNDCFKAYCVEIEFDGDSFLFHSKGGPEGFVVTEEHVERHDYITGQKSKKKSYLGTDQCIEQVKSNAELMKPLNVGALSEGEVDGGTVVSSKRTSCDETDFENFPHGKVIDKECTEEGIMAVYQQRKAEQHSAELLLSIQKNRTTSHRELLWDPISDFYGDCCGTDKICDTWTDAECDDLDPLDQACCYHDKCIYEAEQMYQPSGWGGGITCYVQGNPCPCDVLFQADLSAAVLDSTCDATCTAYAASAYLAFELLSCTCKDDDCHWWGGCWEWDCRFPGEFWCCSCKNSYVDLDDSGSPC